MFVHLTAQQREDVTKLAQEGVRKVHYRYGEGRGSGRFTTGTGMGGGQEGLQQVLGGEGIMKVYNRYLLGGEGIIKV